MSTWAGRTSSGGALGTVIFTELGGAETSVRQEGETLGEGGELF